MHTQNPDPSMFGSEGQQKNIAANEKAAFSKAPLKNATGALQGSRSESREATGIGELHQVTSTLESALAAATPSCTPGPSNSLEDPNKGSLAVKDGLLRVRICSVITCHAPVPINCHWKMCETCRVRNRKRGIAKPDRIPQPSKHRTGHICSRKNCANLLDQTVGGIF